MKEKEAYKDNLDRIYELFPDQELIKAKQIAQAYHLSIRTVKERFPLKEGIGITRESLARFLS